MAWEYTCLETLNHRDLMREANTLGADGWQLITVDHAHEFWVGFFSRERPADAVEPAPAVRDRTGAGVLALAGGF